MKSILAAQFGLRDPDHRIALIAQPSHKVQPSPASRCPRAAVGSSRITTFFREHFRPSHRNGLPLAARHGGNNRVQPGQGNTQPLQQGLDLCIHPLLSQDPRPARQPGTACLFTSGKEILAGGQIVEQCKILIDRLNATGACLRGRTQHGDNAMQSDLSRIQCMYAAEALVQGGCPAP